MLRSEFKFVAKVSEFGSQGSGRSKTGGDFRSDAEGKRREDCASMMGCHVAERGYKYTCEVCLAL